MFQQAIPILALGVQLAFCRPILTDSGQAQGRSLASGDTLTVIGRRVVFYALCQAEYESLAGEESADMNEVIADFQLYVGGVRKLLNPMSLPIDVTSASVVRFEFADGRTWHFDRTKETIAVGMILYDGIRQPSVLPGVDTDIGWINQIKLYFNLR